MFYCITQLFRFLVSSKEHGYFYSTILYPVNDFLNSNAEQKYGNIEDNPAMLVLYILNPENQLKLEDNLLSKSKFDWLLMFHTKSD